MADWTSNMYMTKHDYWTWMNTFLFRTNTWRMYLPLAHPSDLSSPLHVETNSSNHLSIQTQHHYMQLETHMRVAALFMICSWTLTEQHFIHKAKVKQQQKLCAGVGDRHCESEGRKCGVGGWRSVWRAWETPLYSHSIMMEGRIMCAHVHGYMFSLVHASAFVTVCVFYVSCTGCLRNATLWLWACPQGFRLMFPLGCCLEILHPEHSYAHRTCTLQLQHTLTNCPLTSSNSSRHKYHISLLPFSLVCHSCPNTEMSMGASKEANNTLLHQHLHHDANTVSPKLAFSKYNSAVAQH